MEQLDQIRALRDRLVTLRRRGGRIAFVPTMGNLHRGHIELVRQAAALAEHVVVSIYVNPTQFGEGEDLAAYPRTLQQDREKLEQEGVALLFTPNDGEIYPPQREGTGDQQVRVEVAGLSELLCGASRPGHFTGVASVVSKLFNIVQPDIALFGEKDFQQLLVIRQLVEQLNFPIEVVGVPTYREKDGLAMSSRNGYLTPQQREQAPRLYHTLQWVKGQLVAGRRDFESIEQEAREPLEMEGFRLDYLLIRHPATLQPIETAGQKWVVLVAAWLGNTRLIDNYQVNLR
ncbi:MAG: pantoate--beta-alanine ligase [Gammaproteobacteria bacterium]|jgi:pantoate--beta-alanine ligase|nr:pantoate--beta-alanine ligase [Gammaproteobacteria bacterium]MBT7308023.1 pantoate--beta-alanine ligase [Gammaproteobacteria bacterium]